MAEGQWPHDESADPDLMPLGDLAPGVSAYAVTRGYAYVESKPKGAVHGAVTPQEAVVPFMSYDQRTADDAYHGLKVSIDGEIRRRRAENELQLRITNPNTSPVIIDSVSVRLAEVAGRATVSIEAGQSVEVGLTLDASNLLRPTVTLPVDLRLRANGQARDFHDELTLPTVGAAVSDTEFEEEFD